MWPSGALSGPGVSLGVKNCSLSSSSFAATASGPSGAGLDFRLAWEVAFCGAAPVLSPVLAPAAIAIGSAYAPLPGAATQERQRGRDAHTPRERDTHAHAHARNRVRKTHTDTQR